MSNNKTTRRHWLLGAGAASMAVPLLPSLLTRPFSSAKAQAERNVRFIQIATDHAIDRVNLTPLPADHAETLTPETQLDEITKAQSLEAIIAQTGRITPAMSGAQWEALAPHMNIISGSNLSTANSLHNSCAATTFSSVVGENRGPQNPFSLDYLAEQKLARGDHSFPALRAAFFYHHGAGYIHLGYRGNSYGGDEMRLPQMEDIAELEAALGGITRASNEGDPRDAHRAKMIDLVKDQYDRLLRNPRLSRLDKDRLESAVDLWNDAANRRTTMTCGDLPPNPGIAETGAINWRILHEYAMDLMAYALACDLTPVVAYTLPHAGDHFPNTRAEHGTMHGPQHGSTNDALPHERYETMKSWRLQRVAHFASRLAELQDASGESVLDNSLLYFGQEFARQGHNHIFTGWHSLLLGGAGGRLQTGNVLNVYGESRREGFRDIFDNGAPFNRVGLTVLHALGLGTAEIEGITGRVGFGEYGSRDEDQLETLGLNYRLTNAGRDRYASDAEKRKTFPILQDA